MISNLMRRATIRPFTRRGAIIGTSFRDISSSKKNDLLDYCQRRNPFQLMAELLNIRDSKHNRIFPSTTPMKENFGEIIARICVQKMGTQIDFAFEMLECLNDHTPGSMASGALVLVDRCVEYRHIEDAMKTYKRIRSMSLLLDTPRKDRLVSLLASCCRVSDLTAVISDHSITDTDLSVSAEPLIMSGKVITYSNLLNRFLDQKRNSHDPIQSPEDVSRIIRSIMAARLKRYYDSSAPSEDENEGMQDILITLDDYFIRLQCSVISSHANTLSSQSYFQNRQLCEMEKERGLEMNHNHKLPVHQLELMDHLPEFEATDFPFVTEGNGQMHIEPIHRLRIKDLTSELKRKDPTTILLYAKCIFPDTFEMISSYLLQRSLVEAVKKLMKQTGHYVDATHEDEEERTPSFMKPTGHNGLPPPFSLYDISYELKNAKPSLNLLFENDVFDRRHDVESDEILVTEFLDKKPFNRPKINTPDSSSAASSSSQSDSSNSLIPKPEEEDKPETK